MDKKLYSLMNWRRIEGIVYSEEDHPHDFLGIHSVSGGLLAQAFFPGAKTVELLFHMGGADKKYLMEQVDEEGFFATYIKSVKKTGYTYSFAVDFPDGRVANIIDPYAFPCTVNLKDAARFNAGICYNIYDVLGAHIKTIDGVCGTSFAVWAPNAVRVSVVGDFNNWDGRIHQMRRLEDTGIFEIFIPGVSQGAIYKYELKLKGGNISLKSDPYAFMSQCRPDTASIVWSVDDYQWNDAGFVSSRSEYNASDRPMVIYEMYAGSFVCPEDGKEYANYRELAEPLIGYIQKMGYTHVEMMPLMEHPLDSSWGYQVIGYYSPTSRYGTPQDLMYLIDKLHEAGIAVIFDWVPAHFPRDIHGLSNFDGTALYEHQDPRRGFHPHWGTLIFNYGRPEVSNYLIANALFWIMKYHVDGIRMDAVASMLYWDYGKSEGQWLPNIYGGNENLEAVELIKHLNSINQKMNTGALMIAEESTAWPKVSGSLDEDGLGFDYKWNMGWMNDFIRFMRMDPLYRGDHFGELTFSMIYAYSERFILSFSHDEAVHGKGSMIAKMPGDRYDQFANLRLAYAYMFAHPGKKLLFMGQDLAEYEEWNEKRCVRWDLLQYEEHERFNEYVRDLIKLYHNQSPLYELDHTPDGFEWINNISANETILVFLRKDSAGKMLLVLCNFANVGRTHYKIGVPFSGKYKEIFNSDAEKYGGGGLVNSRVKVSKLDECDQRPYSIRVTVAPLSVSVFSCEEIAQNELETSRKPRTKKREIHKK